MLPAARGQHLVAACQKQKRPAAGRALPHAQQNTHLVCYALSVACFAESAGSHQQPAKRVGLSAAEARATAPVRSQQRKPNNPQRFGSSPAAGRAYIAQQQDDPYAFVEGPSDSDQDEEAEEELQHVKPVQAQGAGRGTGALAGPPHTWHHDRHAAAESCRVWVEVWCVHKQPQCSNRRYPCPCGSTSALPAS